MKILMVNVPFSGHVNPTLALAEELVRRGIGFLIFLTTNGKNRLRALEQNLFLTGIMGISGWC